MVGTANEIKVEIDKKESTALLDSGSQITTVNEEFYQNFLSHAKLEDCDNILTVSGITGHRVHYKGYILAELKIALSDDTSFSHVVPVLVVPVTKYNSAVPIILGSNFIRHIPDNKIPFKNMFSQVKMALSCVQQSAQYLEENPVIGSIESCETFIVPAHSSKLITGSTVVDARVHNQLVIIEGIADDVPVVPGVTDVSAGEKELHIEVSNCSDKAIEIPKGKKIATISQAKIETNSVENNSTNVESHKVTDEFLASFQVDHLSEADSVELKSFLAQNRDVFAMSSSEMGCTNVVKHKIELVNPEPIKEKCRPIPPSAYDELREHLAELLSADIIEESTSPYSSNIVTVRKKCGGLRMCIDYRKLNLFTKKNAYGMPRSDDLVDCLQGAKYFASLDLFSGYHQIGMDEESKEYTAFTVGALGFYQFKRLPFGLCNSQSTFQYMMEHVLHGLVMKICCCYIDDVLVFADTKKQLYERLMIIFDRLRKANLTLKPKKCVFFKSEVEFLGHIVSSKGVQCSNKHLEAVEKWPEPSNVQELQTFLGFTGFHRRYIEGYSRIAQPMLKLLRGTGEDKEKKQVKKTTGWQKKGRQKKKAYEKVAWEWGTEQQESFNRLKQAVMSAPVLKYPEPSKPYILHVDASRKALGASLLQESDDGKVRPVAYASRSLTGSERNYTVHKLEFLGLKWAVTCKFQHYLYGNKCTVYTDHNPLTYVTSTAKLDANGHRWVADLSAYDLEIRYKPGRLNTDADALSRLPYPIEERNLCTKVISKDVFKQLCDIVASDRDYTGVAESLGLSPTVVCNALSVSYPVTIDWSQEQGKDPDIDIVRTLVIRGEKPTERQRLRHTPVALRLLSHWESLKVRNGILVKTSKLGTINKERVVIPKQRQQEVLTMIHDEMGHLGRDKTMSVAQERFFWVGLSRDIDNKVKTCRRCICAKSPNLPEKAPLVSIVTSRPMELVCIDFMSLEMSKGGYQNILVVTDHFTRYAQAFPTRNQEAKTVAKILVEQFFVHYGLPERLHSDNGANFQGRVITHLCQMLGIEKSRTTIYHPQGNGMTERFNHTLINMLKTLDPSLKPDWKEHVAPLVHAYNSTRHESTGFTPFYLMFGRSPRLPVDVFLGLDSEYSAGIESLRDRLSAAYKAAENAANRASERQASNYDRKVRGQGLLVGDAVLLKNVGLKGKNKIADKWQTEAYVVIDKPNDDVPVYKIKRGKEVKTVHRNLILPISSPVKPSVKPVNVRRRMCRNYDEDADRQSSSDSDEFDVQVRIDFPISLQESRDPEAVADMFHTNDSSVTPSGVVNSEQIPSGVVKEKDSPSGVSKNHNDNIDIPEEYSFVGGADSGIPLDHEGYSEENPRRTGRDRKKPDRFGNNIMSGEQRVTSVELSDPGHNRANVSEFTDWRERVSILLSLLDLFPGHKDQLLYAMINVITSCK